jgi:hypothetical protein
MMFPALILAAVLSGGHRFGDNPQTAVLTAVYAPAGKTVTIMRTNIVGRYATVRLRGALIAGESADDAAILLEHFSFGWQPIESLNFRGRLDGHAIPVANKVRLMDGMPAMKPGEEFDDRDVGPVSDVESARLLSDQEFTPYVRVSGRYALVASYGGGGGEFVVRRVANGWQLVAGGGGPASAEILAERGLPHATICALRVHAAYCASR